MIALERVGKRFDGADALVDCTLSVEKGAFFVLVGPSGCGKSTLLRTINGLIVPDTGTVSVRGEAVAAQDPAVLRRSVGYVIQTVGLFPHWTVADNLAAVPRLLGWDRARVARRVDEMAAMLRIDPALLPRFPHQLSGGQRQRIGVARALAGGADLILMDEPFSALDPVSRLELQIEMRRIHAQSGTTIVMVTHDVGEALRLATALAVMRAGRILQVGTPQDVVGAPAEPFVAAFLGGDERFLHLLDALPVAAATAAGTEALPAIAATATLRAALAQMMAANTQALAVEGEAGRIGTLRLAALLAAAGAAGPHRG